MNRDMQIRIEFPKALSQRTQICRKPEADAQNIDNDSSSPNEILLKVQKQLKSNNIVTLP